MLLPLPSHMPRLIRGSVTGLRDCPAAWPTRRLVPVCLPFLVMLYDGWCGAAAVLGLGLRIVSGSYYHITMKTMII